MRSRAVRFASLLAAIATGMLPAAIAYGMLVISRLADNVSVFALAFVAFGFLTPVVMSTASSKVSAAVALALATLFLVARTVSDTEELDMLPWWLFAWGLFPAIGLTTAMRVAPVRHYPIAIPVALLAAVVARMLISDRILAVSAFVLLLLDLFVTRRAKSPPS